MKKLFLVLGIILLIALIFILSILFGGRYVRDYKSYHRIGKTQQLNEETIVYTRELTSY